MAAAPIPLGSRQAHCDRCIGSAANWALDPFSRIGEQRVQVLVYIPPAESMTNAQMAAILEDNAVRRTHPMSRQIAAKTIERKASEMTAEKAAEKRPRRSVLGHKTKPIKTRTKRNYISNNIKKSSLEWRQRKLSEKKSICASLSGALGLFK